MSEQNEQNTQEPQSQSIPPVSGKPNVTGKRKKSKSGAILFFLAFAVLVGGLATLYAFKFLSDDEVEDLAKTEQLPSLTSSRELTVPPIPPEEPKIEAPEEIEEIKESEPVVIVQQPTLPQIPVQKQAEFDANGDPVPTLEELKFAAPMMGVVDNQHSTSSSNDEVALSSNASFNETDSSEGRDLSQRLKSVSTPASAATRIKDQSLILSKGTVIECILESRVDTTVPGMTTCVIPRDVYSMNGRVLLIEKGTKAIGEYQGSVANGLARIFMLWTELRTPHGISIQLNSPAADALGGAGMGGYVDYHWFKRFGNALLFSMISDGFQYAINTANSNNNNGDVTYKNTENGMDEIIREAMRQSGNIPPTLIKNQGERVSIFVSRDLSFNNVYGIKAHGNR